MPSVQDIAASVQFGPKIAIVAPPEVAPPLRPEDVPPCPCKRSKGKWCYQIHPAEMGSWCEDCLGGADPGGELPDWLTAGTGMVPPREPDAPGEPRLPMADWIEVQAQALRLKRSNLADWLAARLDAIATTCRLLDATTPDEFDAREEVMERDIAERDRILDHDYYHLGV